MILKTHEDIGHAPKRIISLVPSQTELLHWLGLEEEVTGITKFCVHPSEWFRSKTRVGGTKNIHIDIIKKLNPDLIIANKEENVKEQIEVLAIDYNVLVTDVNTVDEALQMIQDIGNITCKANRAEELVTAIKKAFARLPSHNNPIPTAYLIWKDPYMSVGHDTFIHDMLTRAGFQNIFAESTRYPEINISQLKTLNCKLILLSSEPYPFKQKHIDELQQQLPGVKIMLVDGELFSWYGSRMLLAPAYLNNLVI